MRNAERGITVNYDKLMQEILAANPHARILMHCCCAPCASYCFDRLSGQNVTAYFYNPNIMPHAEYQKRAEELQKLCALKNVPVSVCAYDNTPFCAAAQGLEDEKEGGKRCAECFRLRLTVAAQEAKKRGLEYFCTTLTVSPHKNSDLINSIGFEIEKEQGVKYLPSDFKKNNGYKRSIELSKEYSLYRQDYCGCAYSQTAAAAIRLPPQLQALAQKINLPLYVVGGYIRNQICNFPFSADIDICGPFLSGEFVKTGAKVVPVNKKLGTALIIFEGERFEFTPFRKENYPKGGAHSPSAVEFIDDLRQDALRRDFTANAIYYDVLNGAFDDPLGGIKDAQSRVLRAYNPDYTFNSDGLRLMRLCRFAAELGFSIDPKTFNSAKKNADKLRDIAAERKREELDKILYADQKYGIKDAHYRGLKYLTEINLWEYILPSMTVMDIPQNPKYHIHSVLEHTLLAVKFAPKQVRLAALMHDTGKPVCQAQNGNMHGHADVSSEIAWRELGQSGLKYPNDTVHEIAELCRLHMYDLNQKTHEGKMRLFAAENYRYLDLLQDLCVADGKATGQTELYTPRFLEFKNKLNEDNTPVSLSDLKIDGHDVIAAGYAGAEISQILDRLWRECILNPSLNNREWLLKQLSPAGGN